MNNSLPQFRFLVHNLAVRGPGPHAGFTTEGEALWYIKEQTLGMGAHVEDKETGETLEVGADGVRKPMREAGGGK